MQIRPAFAEVIMLRLSFFGLFVSGGFPSYLRIGNPTSDVATERFCASEIGRRGRQRAL